MSSCSKRWQMSMCYVSDSVYDSLLIRQFLLFIATKVMVFVESTKFYA